MKINKFVIYSIAFSSLFVSCNDDSDENLNPDYIYTDGVLVSGEGSGAGTGSVSYVPNDFSAPSHLIYKTENDAELGTYLQSMAFSDTKAYISVDNQHTITVVDRYSFKEMGKINSQLEHPRYMEIVGNTGYATNWGSTAVDTDDFIAVIDLETNSVTKTIPVGMGPERIIARDGKLYVTHKGAFGVNNKVSVIDIATEAVVEITVGDKPDELFFDANGDLFVLSEGAVEYDMSWNVIGHTPASIAKINTNTNTVSATLSFGDAEHPSLLEIDGDDLYYYLNTAVYTLKTSDTSLPTTAHIDTGSIYGMAIHNSQLYTVVANFSALSELKVYNISSKSLIHTTEVAIGASKIYFND